MESKIEQRNNTIFVNGFGRVMDEPWLQEIFSRYGIILKISKTSTVAYITYNASSSAYRAVKEENRKDYDGKIIVVEIARPKKHLNRNSSNFRSNNRSNNSNENENDYLGSSQSSRNTFSPTASSGNQVEIICPFTDGGFIAFEIEKRIKKMSLRVDVLFLNANMSANIVIENAAKRGVCYAILLTSHTSSSGSVTLHVLRHGSVQQEHRNMPIDDALAFISKKYVKDSLTLEDDSHIPRDILSILEIFKENRPLSVMEYDKLIKYFNQRRHDVLKMEYGNIVPSHLLHPPPLEMDPSLRAKQEGMYAKIKYILTMKKSEDISLKQKINHLSLPSSSKENDVYYNYYASHSN